MKKTIQKIRTFLVSEDGPTAVEYAVMLALIILACVATIGQLGAETSASFEPVRNILGAGGS